MKINYFKKVSLCFYLDWIFLSWCEIFFSTKTRNPKDPIYPVFWSLVLLRFVKNVIYMISN